MNPHSDRRTRPRFDIVGALWGQLELDEPARICNVSTTGILVDASVPAALQGEQVVRLVVEGQPVTVDARVRRVQAARDRTDTASRYFVGLEFVSPPTSVLQSIEQLNVNG